MNKVRTKKYLRGLQHPLLQSRLHIDYSTFTASLTDHGFPQHELQLQSSTRFSIFMLKKSGQILKQKLNIFQT